jgi:hypothetical protein
MKNERARNERVRNEMRMKKGEEGNGKKEEAR